MALDGADGTLVPMLLVAVTVKVYVAPGVSPPTVACVLLAETVIFALPGEAFTV